LDYGCGQGALGRALNQEISEYDPAIAGKDSSPQPADLVICTDVLEHIEPECLESVLDHLKSLTKEALFAVISTRPAKKTLADGRNAHLIIEPWSFWEEKLARRFRVEERAIHHKEVEVLLLRR
jgi:2-polyprenyl-3-methyl-5-hydroxy-6-metoxy-1,4-benzoquinol methylase